MNTNTPNVHFEDKELELLEFYIDYEEEVNSVKEIHRVNYGINLAKIVEVIHCPDKLTSFPHKGHKASIGSFNLRGQIVSIIDLALWLDIPTRPEHKRKVIILNYCGKPTGFLVCDLSSIHHLTWADVMAPNEYVGKFSDNTIIGVIQKEKKLIFMLDVEQILASINPSLSLQDMKFGEQPLLEDAGNYTIMIAEDSSPIRTIIGRNIEGAGFNVLKTVSGRDCYDELIKLKNKSIQEGVSIRNYVDAIISDIEMPEMDGYALTKKVKEDDVLKELPVILFSSLITETILKRGKELGVAAQISKPDLPMLAQTLTDIIKAQDKK